MDIFNVKPGVTYKYYSVMKDYIGGDVANNNGEQNRPQVCGISRSGQSQKEEKDRFKPVLNPLKTELNPICQ